MQSIGNLRLFHDIFTSSVDKFIPWGWNMMTIKDHGSWHSYHGWLNCQLSHGVLIMTHPIQLFFGWRARRLMQKSTWWPTKKKKKKLWETRLQWLSGLFTHTYLQFYIYIYKYTCIYLYIYILLVFTPSYIILYMLDIQIYSTYPSPHRLKKSTGATGTEVWTHRPTGLLRQGGGDDSWRVRRVRKLDILYKDNVQKTAENNIWCHNII